VAEMQVKKQQEARETNLAAQLIRENGFHAVSVRRSCRADAFKDAYVVQYRHRPVRQPAVEQPGRIRRLAG
jgi:hypothetical protein